MNKTYILFLTVLGGQLNHFEKNIDFVINIRNINLIRLFICLETNIHSNFFSLEK